MELGPDAILFTLALVEEKALSAGEAAEHLRAAAAGGGSDRLVALQERILERSPGLEATAARLAAAPGYTVVDCPSCRARFRVPGERPELDAYCPLCAEAITGGRHLLQLWDLTVRARRAAEEEPGYETGHVGRFAHFGLVRMVGSGGAGRVFEARNRRSGRTVALKLLDFRPLETVAETMERLRREARVASALTHPHIVPILDLGVAEGIAYIEMEFVRGTPLRDYVRERGFLPPAEARRLCAEALAGLACVHAQKIIHRDIKPSNILIDRRKRARLTDFGISKFLEETTTMPSSEKVVGSPHFMAPEQWRGEAVSPRTDVYAMGLVLYYALTGRRPYGDAGPLALMYRHLHEPLLDPSLSHPSIPDPLARIIRRATEKDPDDRFASADEFAEALRALPEADMPGLR